MGTVNHLRLKRIPLAKRPTLFGFQGSLSAHLPVSPIRRIVSRCLMEWLVQIGGILLNCTAVSMETMISAIAL